MIEQVSLSTSRLILRPFSLTDATELQRLAGYKVIADTTVSIPHPYNLSIAQNQIKTYQQDFIEGKAVHFAIALKETNQFISIVINL
ncbi:MAG: GNAT family N-acetyltransferase [Cyanobacteria bacterium J06592_8]